MSRMSRDVEGLDNTIPTSYSQLIRTFSAFLGAIFLIFYIFPYLGIAIPVLFFFFYVAAVFYRYAHSLRAFILH